MQSNYAHLPSILQPPNFPFWAMDNNESNCIELDLGHSTNVRWQTYPKKHGPLPKHAISSGIRQTTPPGNVVANKREKGYLLDSSSFHDRAERATENAMRTTQSIQTLPFKQAADIWLEFHRETIKDRTYKDYLFYIRTLNKYFGPRPENPMGMLLSQIRIGHIIEYRRDRQLRDEAKGKRGAGAWCINHEVNTLKQIMEMAGIWDEIEKMYKPMRIPISTAPKVMSPDEEDRFFKIAAGKDDWKVAYYAASMTNNTSAYGAELRLLQLKHIFMEHTPPKIHIPDDGAKNDFRARVVPLNVVAFKQMTRLLERANKLGARKPDHFLFPFRIKKGEYDVNRPASQFFIRSAFRSICKATGIKITPRNLRNQIITKLFESGAPDETIISIAGHQAIKMSRWYSRIRIHAKVEALDKIASKSETGQMSKGERA